MVAAGCRTAAVPRASRWPAPSCAAGTVSSSVVGVASDAVGQRRFRSRICDAVAEVSPPRSLQRQARMPSRRGTGGRRRRRGAASRRVPARRSPSAVSANPVRRRYATDPPPAGPGGRQVGEPEERGDGDGHPRRLDVGERREHPLQRLGHHGVGARDQIPGVPPLEASDDDPDRAQPDRGDDGRPPGDRAELPLDTRRAPAASTRPRAGCPSTPRSRTAGRDARVRHPRRGGSGR